MVVFVLVFFFFFGLFRLFFLSFFLELITPSLFVLSFFPLCVRSSVSLLSPSRLSIGAWWWWCWRNVTFYRSLDCRSRWGGGEMGCMWWDRGVGGVRSTVRLWSCSSGQAAKPRERPIRDDRGDRFDALHGP